MRELVEPVASWLAEGLPVALATVVSTWGSAPRGVGSMMAVTTDQRFAGSVSGGCVESAVVDAADEVLATGRPTRLSFGVSDETAWSVGLACGGQIEVWVDRPDHGALMAILAAARDHQRLRCAMVLAGPAGYPGRRLVEVDGSVCFDNVPAALAGGVHGVLAMDTAAARRTQTTAGVTLVEDHTQVPGTEAEVFFLNLPPPPTLIIIGAVHIAVSLTELARPLGFRTAVIDPRAAFTHAARFPMADQVLVAWPAEALTSLPLTPTTAVVALAHDPKIDDPALVMALDSAAFYVGALGSRRTQAARRERLLAQGVAAEAVARLRGPVGIDIGAESPAEIALAVLAEVVRARNVETGMAADRIIDPG
jgi:xanthine dehydrogenase accessory factor